MNYMRRILQKLCSKFSRQSGGSSARDASNTTQISCLCHTTPDWLSGWWRITCDGEYFYHFGHFGNVRCSHTPPPIDTLSGEGDFTVFDNGTILISWIDEDSTIVALEKFVNATPNSITIEGIGAGGWIMTGQKLVQL